MRVSPPSAVGYQPRQEHKRLAERYPQVDMPLDHLPVIQGLYLFCRSPLGVDGIPTALGGER